MTAGIGEFAPEVATVGPPGFYQFFAAGSVTDLFSNALIVWPNPAVSGSCTGALNCASYFFTGGLLSIAPSAVYFRATSPEAEAITVEGEPGLQIDYWDIAAEDRPFVAESDCLTWIPSSQEAGLMICLRSSSLNSEYLIAGLSSC